MNTDTTHVRLFEEGYWQHALELGDAPRAAEPVHRAEVGGYLPVWVIGRYADARRALTDPHLSKDATLIRPVMERHLRAAGLPTELSGLFRPHMLFQDEPAHGRLRRLLADKLTHPRIERLRPQVLHCLARGTSFPRPLSGIRVSGSRGRLQATAQSEPTHRPPARRLPSRHLETRASCTTAVSTFSRHAGVVTHPSAPLRLDRPVVPGSEVGTRARQTLSAPVFSKIGAFGLARRIQGGTASGPTAHAPPRPAVGAMTGTAQSPGPPGSVQRAFAIGGLRRFRDHRLDDGHNLTR